ncbi:hypothetical protein JA9_003752 [Meyerozyma sp. JA9]|nr:hypothetical protein JA9_003752 [Meyerozyma sp. JA9]
MLPVPYASQWRVVSIVQVAYFAVILITFLTGLLVRIFKVDAFLRKTIFTVSIYFTLFSSFKIAGGVCATLQVDQKTPSEGLMIATYILDTTSLGFLLKTIVNYLDYMMFPRSPAGPDNGENPDFQETEIGFSHRKDSEGSSVDLKPTDPKKKLSRFHPFRLTTLVITVAIVLSIVGASKMSSGSGGSNSGTYFKVSSLLFLIALISSSGLLFWVYLQRPTFRTGVTIIMFSLVFYLVRIIYSIVSSFTGIDISSTSFNKFTLIFGDYKYYTFMAFLMESLIALMLFVISQWFLMRNPTHY